MRYHPVVTQAWKISGGVVTLPLQIEVSQFRGPGKVGNSIIRLFCRRRLCTVKFTRASSDKADMDFFRGTSSPRAEVAVATRVPVIRQAAPISGAGSPAAGASTVQVTASTSTSGAPQPGPITLKRQH